MKKIRFIALLAGLVLLSSLGGNAVWAKNWNLSNDPQSADQNIGVELFGTLGMANFEAVEDRYIKQPHDTLNISDVTLFMVTSDILRDGKGQDNEVRYYRGDRCPPLMVTPAYEMAGKPNIVWFYEEFKNEEKLEDIINLFVNDIGYQACMHMGSSNNYEDGQHKKDQLRFFYKKCPNGLTSLANVGSIKFCLDKFNVVKSDAGTSGPTPILVKPSKTVAKNWSQKKQEQTSRLPDVFVSLARDNYGEGVYTNKTSDLTTVGEQLGHLNLWLNICSYDLGPRYKKFKNLEILFKKHASKKDFGLYSQSRNVKGFGISVVGSTKCKMKLVTGVQAVMEKAIRWLKENPGFDLPAPNEWQTKKIGKWGSPDVGQFSKSVSNTTQSSASSTTSTLSKADKSKAFCKDIGFTAGTEKFGECVLKMMDK